MVREGFQKKAFKTYRSSSGKEKEERAVWAEGVGARRYPVLLRTENSQCGQSSESEKEA